MPTKKIADLKPLCRHPNHNPPMHQLFDNGVYEHTCPGCGETQTFMVERPTL